MDTLAGLDFTAMTDGELRGALKALAAVLLALPDEQVKVSSHALAGMLDALVDRLVN